MILKSFDRFLLSLDLQFFLLILFFESFFLFFQLFDVIFCGLQIVLVACEYFHDLNGGWASHLLLFVLHLLFLLDEKVVLDHLRKDIFGRVSIFCKQYAIIVHAIFPNVNSNYFKTILFSIPIQYG